MMTPESEYARHTKGVEALLRVGGTCCAPRCRNLCGLCPPDFAGAGRTWCSVLLAPELLHHRLLVLCWRVTSRFEEDKEPARCNATPLEALHEMVRCFGALQCWRCLLEHRRQRFLRCGGREAARPSAAQMRQGPRS